MRRFVLLLLLGGCESFFPLTSPEPPDCVPVGHDEDGDAIDDACDNCPFTANPQQEDVIEIQSQGDADGIGDICDPHPAAGDRLVVFESFGDPGANNRWNQPVWQIDPTDQGALANAGMGGAVNFAVDAVVHEAVVPVTAIFHVTVDSVPAASGEVGIAIDLDGTDSGLRCELSHFGSSGENYAHIQDDQHDPLESDGNTSLTLKDADGFTIQLDYDGATETCLVSPDTGTETDTATLPTAVPPSGRFGFIAIDMPAHVHYVAIYTPL